MVAIIMKIILAILYIAVTSPPWLKERAYRMTPILAAIADVIVARHCGIFLATFPTIDAFSWRRVAILHGRMPQHTARLLG